MVIVVFVDLVEWVKILQLVAVNVAAGDHWLLVATERIVPAQVSSLLGLRAAGGSAGCAVERIGRLIGDCRLRNVEWLG